MSQIPDENLFFSQDDLQILKDLKKKGTNFNKEDIINLEKFIFQFFKNNNQELTKQFLIGLADDENLKKFNKKDLLNIYLAIQGVYVQNIIKEENNEKVYYVNFLKSAENKLNRKYGVKISQAPPLPAREPPSGYVNTYRSNVPWKPHSDYRNPRGGKKKTRKHSGINQQTGRLKKGYKYSGKKLKSGMPQIVKI